MDSDACTLQYSNTSYYISELKGYTHVYYAYMVQVPLTQCAAYCLASSNFLCQVAQTEVNYDWPFLLGIGNLIYGLVCKSCRLWLCYDRLALPALHIVAML